MRPHNHAHKKMSILFRMVCIAAIAALLVLITVLVINMTVCSVGKDRIFSPDAAVDFEADCILVLGAGVRSDGTPSDMLRDRIIQGVELYLAGYAPVILMSGDSQSPEQYDEVGVMKEYAISMGVPEECILTDPLGLNTFESLKNLKQNHDFKKIIIVSQEYHLLRAIFMADDMGLDAIGSSADLNAYRFQWYRDLREALARCKDFVIVKLVY